MKQLSGQLESMQILIISNLFANTSFEKPFLLLTCNPEKKVSCGLLLLIKSTTCPDGVKKWK